MPDRQRTSAKRPILRGLLTLAIVLAAAWLLGILFGPALVKALFL